LQRTSCIARSCEILELPANSSSYGDCRSILESGSRCRPQCSAGFLLDIEFECSRGTLKLGSCKADDTTPAPEDTTTVPYNTTTPLADESSEKSFAEKAFPYAIAGGICLLCLFISVVASLCWCQSKQASKHRLDIEGVRESNQSSIESHTGLIEQLRRGIDELNRRTLLSEQDRRELIQLRMPALPLPESVDGEEWPRGGVRTLSMLGHRHAPAASMLGAYDEVLHADDIRVDIVDEVGEEYNTAARSSISPQGGCMPSWSPA